MTSLLVEDVGLAESRRGPFASALNLLSRKLVDLNSLVSAFHPLDDTLAAFERTRSKDTLKVWVRPWEGLENEEPRFLLCALGPGIAAGS